MCCARHYGRAQQTTQSWHELGQGLCGAPLKSLQTSRAKTKRQTNDLIDNLPRNIAWKNNNAAREHFHGSKTCRSTWGLHGRCLVAIVFIIQCDKCARVIPFKPPSVRGGAWLTLECLLEAVVTLSTVNSQPLRHTTRSSLWSVDQPCLVFCGLRSHFLNNAWFRGSYPITHVFVALTFSDRKSVV